MPKQSACFPSKLSAHAPLIASRKHWRQLDDFHSLTDLKIAVSSHREPQITAGLRSVCWKVVNPQRSPSSDIILDSIRRSSCSSKLSTAHHGLLALQSRVRRTPRSARTISAPSSIQMSSNPLSIRSAKTKKYACLASAHHIVY